MAARAVDDVGCVLVLVDDLHRHEAFARIGQGDRHRPRVEIEDRRGIERVAIEPDDGLVVDRRRLAAMDELAEAAILDDVAEVQIALGAREVVGGDGNGAGLSGASPAPTGTSGGAFHFPSSAAAFGQYSRMTTKNGPLGAGSQLASFPAPGESCWT